MDPGLEELILNQEGEHQVEAIIKLKPGSLPPEQVQIVTRFGDIATCRLACRDIEAVWSEEVVVSLKAPRTLSIDPEPLMEDLFQEENFSSAYQRRPSISPTGQGVVVALADWGIDFTHPNFLNADGSTRFLALWDQSANLDESAANYGYGRIYFKEEINAALQSDSPFDVLDYHPATGDPLENGAHGTHVLDIAAGNGAVGQTGIAPEADLVAVHLSSGKVSGLSSLGDSVSILEAIHFMDHVAGQKPLVINLSVGKHGGSHQGNSLVEQGMDNFLREKLDRCIVQSTGNYYTAKAHSSGRLQQGESKTLIWKVDTYDATPNELEIWYPQTDVFSLSLKNPDNQELFTAELGKITNLRQNGERVGRIYHRANEPNTGDHHINIFLYNNSATGPWELTLTGKKIENGQFHSWIERDAFCRGCQSKFDEADVDANYTTGTICNGFETIAVGAYNPHVSDFKIASFSSAGPTADGRQKPNLVAPGLAIEAAKSAALGEVRSAGELTVKSGTSMAAPHVTGAVALIMAASEVSLKTEEVRNKLQSGVKKEPIHSELNRLGEGVLDIAQLFPMMTTNAIVDMSTNSKMDGIKPKLDMKEDFQTTNLPEQNDFDREITHFSERIDQGVFEGDDESRLNIRHQSGEGSELFLEDYEDEQVDVIEAVFDPVEMIKKTFANNLNAKKDLVAIALTASKGENGAVIVDPDHIFDQVLQNKSFTNADLNDNIRIVGRPGALLTAPLQAGDILLRKPLGIGKLIFQSMLKTGELLPSRAWNRSSQLESKQSGQFAEVIESFPRMRLDHDLIARRITDETGRIPYENLILRIEPHIENDSQVSTERARNKCFSVPFMTDPTKNLKYNYAWTDIDDKITLASGIPFKGATTTTLQVKGRIYYPSSVRGKEKALKSGLDPFPVIILAHGNHSTHYNPADRFDERSPKTGSPIPSNFLPLKNHLGYKYLQQLFARMGFVSFSLDCNIVSGFINLTINNIVDRSNLIIAAAKYLENEDKNTTSRFHNTLAIDNIGLFGHSRGAEAVLIVPNRLSVAAFDVKRAKIACILSLAPTDAPSTFGLFKATKSPGGIPFLTILPAADGDVVSNAGAKYYDQTKPKVFKTQLYIDNANHNFFNREWVDDDFSNLGFIKRKTALRTLLPKAKRWRRKVLARSVHQRILSVYASAFYLDILSGKRNFRQLLLGKTKVRNIHFNKIHLSAEISNAMTTVDDFEDGNILLNTLGLPVSFPSGLAVDEQLFSQSSTTSFKTFFGNTNGMVMTKTSGSGELKTLLGAPINFNCREIWIRVAEVYNGSTIPSSKTAFMLGIEDTSGIKVFVSSNKVGGLPRPFNRKERDRSLVSRDFTKTILKTFRFPINCFIKNNTSLDSYNIVAIIIKHKDPIPIAYDQIQIV